MKKVFLGGTCGKSTWRDELIPKLNIDYYNPIVDEWTDEAKKTELYMRENCDYCLYVITGDMEGYYSIAEVVDDSNKRPGKTILCILFDDRFTYKQIYSLNQIASLVEKNGGKICFDLEDVLDYLNLNGGKTISCFDLESREFEHLLDYMLQHLNSDSELNCPADTLTDMFEMHDDDREAVCGAVNWCYKFLPLPTDDCPCFAFNNNYEKAENVAIDWIESRKILFRRF